MTVTTMTRPSPEQSGSGYDALLLRETNHRCANDLQLVVSLLALQGRKVTSPEARAALADATSRVAVLARARAGLNQQHQPGLESALRQVCEALHSLAEPRGIIMSIEVEQDAPTLPPDKVATLALVVNELATNAIKHAFENDQDGRVCIAILKQQGDEVVVIVNDDGLPLPEEDSTTGGGLGFGLVRRLVASMGGTFTRPPSGTKRFEIRVPGTTCLRDTMLRREHA